MNLIGLFLKNFAGLLDRDVLPDWLIRLAIRRLLRERLEKQYCADPETEQERFNALLEHMSVSPIAIETASANEQHYEVPTRFYELVLGRYLKYSCGYWPQAVSHLDASEEAMLRLTCERAQVSEGQQILDLGCGWGAFSLYVAEQYPTSKITALSNSRTQREYIEKQARLRGLNNLEVITADINDFVIDRGFDRVVSVEMFEHMRNYAKLLERLARIVKPEGKLFVHVFVHREHAYFFEVEDETDWISKHFFTGGMMPSDRLLLYFQQHFRLQRHWRISGLHYRRTAEAWLENMDKNRSEILKLFADTYGQEQALRWFSYWRIFFMSCSELWGYNSGREWFVSHYLFSPHR
ncbi:MAG: cyclopropane-fatty-acyl-phospholipid synthase family protein [Acidobacteriota bacterium]|nr:cyclopropane-fatty-acyl-phospholipid synthase family protein [Blastocatellia bacterium]MDW8412779.1 cyclopropane-fatty-acyl-phospholipid synthase family protein [Acidobacteriota bacterium]